MGLGDADILDEGDGGGEGKGSAVAVSCSICLDVVMDNGDRSWAKLQCGHQFHLDCIGSAFNIKGAMQCPNCRKIEKGQWLYANGNRPLPDFSMDDWAHDEDLYDPTYSEMSFGDHWCPFSGLTRLPSSFDEGEFPSSAYHGLLGHNAVFTEHAPVASTTHPCPYIAYFGPIHPSISTSSGNVSDGSGFNNHWSANSEVPSTYPFPSMDAHYHIWDQLPPLGASSQIVTADQPSIPSGAQRTARNSDVPRPGMHPFIVGHSSARRAPSSVTSSVLPPYPGPLTRPRDCPVQPNFQQSTTAPIARTSLVSNGRRPNTHRGLGHAAPPTSSPDQSSGFYFSSGSSGRALPEASRTFQEAENRVHVWEQDHHQHHHHPFPVDRESIWAPFHPPADAGIRSGSFQQRHGPQSWS